MRHSHFVITSFLLMLICSFSAVSQPSQVVQLEQDKLITFQQTIDKIQQQQQKLAHDLTGKKGKLTTLQTQLAPLEDARNHARQELDNAQAEASEAPTTENQQKAQNAEFKFILADRKYGKVAVQLGATRDAIEAIQNLQQSNQDQISKTLNAIDAQKQRLKELEQQQEQNAAEQARKKLLAEQQKKEANQLKLLEQKRQQEELARSKQALEKSRAEKRAAEQEIQRLKAMLEQHQSADDNPPPTDAASATNTSAETNTSEKTNDAVVTDNAEKPNPATSMAPTPLTGVADSGPAISTATLPATSAVTGTSANAAIPVNTTTNNTASQLSVQDSAATVVNEASAPNIEQRKHLARQIHQDYLERMQQISSKQRRSMPNKIMTVRTLIDGEVVEKSTHSLSYVGTRLFQDTLTLTVGENRFTVGQDEWIRTIETSASNTTWIVSLDYKDKDKNKPELVIYPANWIDGL